MGDHILKLIDTTIQLSQFFTAISFIVLSAIGAAFYYFWTSDKFNLRSSHLALFLIPTAFIGYMYYYLSLNYSRLLNHLSARTCDTYVELWVVKKAGYNLWIPFYLSVVFLILILAILHHKSKKRTIQKGEQN